MLKNKVSCKRVANEDLVLNPFKVPSCQPIKSPIWSNSEKDVMCILKRIFFPLLNRKRSEKKKNPSSADVNGAVVISWGECSGSRSAKWLLTKYMPSKLSVSCSSNIVKSMNRSLVWKPVGQPSLG